MRVTIEPTNSSQYANIVIRNAGGELRRSITVAWDEAEQKAAAIARDEALPVQYTRGRSKLFKS